MNIETDEQNIVKLIELSNYSKKFMFTNSEKYIETQKELNSLLISMLTKHLYVAKSTILNSIFFKKYMLEHGYLNVLDNFNFETKITLSSNEIQFLICEINFKKYSKTFQFIFEFNYLKDFERIQQIK